MGLLNDITSTVGDTIQDAAQSAFDAVVSSTVNKQKLFERDGFIVPPISSGDGEHLPSQKVSPNRHHIVRRNIMHWFVPEVGLINMYINPQRINYKYSKLITPERTKGGYVVQYWGEALPVLSISGHTGSSGIEGLNVLHEIYRAEQINFDPIALTMASDSAVSGMGDLVGGIGDAIGGIGGSIFSTATNGIMGLNPLTHSILPRNPPTLAAMATGVEMYYSGKVYRGFFTQFSFDESAERVGLFEYNMEFTVTQSRGTRLNNFPWQHSAIHGPSNNSIGGAPLSYGRDFR